MDAINVFQKEIVETMKRDNQEAIQAEALRLAGNGETTFKDTFTEIGEFFTNAATLEELPFQDGYIKLRGISLFLEAVTDALVADKFSSLFGGLPGNREVKAGEEN